MKRTLALLLALLLTASAAMAEGTALDAFHALLAEDGSAPSAPTLSDACLDAALEGRYAQSGMDADAVAEALTALTSVTGRDIAAYASLQGLPVARVRNAWYRALAGVLAAEIQLNPAAGERYRNALAILALFLEPEADEAADAERAEIRGQMSPEAGRRIAEDSSLPEDFVEFVIMSEDWDDDDWENDGDWQQAAGWLDGAVDITVGSRDEPGSTRIADLQEALISLGYLKGKADGVFGLRTQSALIEFQLANGLPGTGVYGAASAMKAASAEAVARWDYGEDFWDSEDFDTPDTPDKQDTPDKRDTPDTPDRKDARDTPDTPDRDTRDSD